MTNEEYFDNQIHALNEASLAADLTLNYFASKGLSNDDLENAHKTLTNGVVWFKEAVRSAGSVCPTVNAGASSIDHANVMLRDLGLPPIPPAPTSLAKPASGS